MLKQIIKKTISLLLLFILLGNITTPAISYNYYDNRNILDIEELEKDYIIISESDTEYGKAYYVKDKISGEERVFWDVIDVVMAGWSWANFFNEPSWKNFGDVVLSTAALAPIIPNIKIAKDSDEILKILKEEIKKDPSKKDKIKNYLRIKTVLPKTTNFPAGQLEAKFKHASEIGFTGYPKRIDDVGRNIRNPAERQRLRQIYLNNFKNKILYTIKKGKDTDNVYRSELGGTQTFLYVDISTKIVVHTKLNGDFLSIFRYSDSQMKNNLKYKVKISR